MSDLLYGCIEYFNDTYKYYYSDHEVWYKWYTKRDYNKQANTRANNLPQYIKLILIKSK